MHILSVAVKQQKRQLKMIAQFEKITENPIVFAKSSNDHQS